MVSQIFSEHSLDDTLAHTLLSRLLAQSKLPGAVSGGGRVYVPSIFLHTRTHWIASFFSQNSYLEYSKLQDLQISDPKAHIASVFPTAVLLKTCAVSEHFLSRVETGLSVCVEEGGWIDVHDHLSFELTPNDLGVLLSKTFLGKKEEAKEGNKKPLHQVDDYFFVSSTFIDFLVSQLEPLVERALREELAEKERKKQKKEQQGEDGEDGEKKDAEKDEEDEEAPEKEEKDADTKKPKKRARKPAAPKGKTAAPAPPTQGSAFSAKNFLSECDVKENDFGPLPLPLTQYLESVLQPHVIRLRDSLKKTIFVTQEATTANTVSAKQRREEIREQIMSLHFNFLHFVNASSALNDEAANIFKHIVRTVCTPLAALFLEDQALFLGIPTDQIAPMLLPTAPAAQRTLFLKQFPHAFTPLIASLSKKSPIEFITLLPAAGEAAEIQLKPLDKKKEKTLVLTLKHTMISQLREMKDASQILHTGCVIAFCLQFNVVLHCPPRSLAALLATLASAAATEPTPAFKKYPGLLDALSALHKLVVAALLSAREEDDDSAPAATPTTAPAAPDSEELAAAAHAVVAILCADPQ
eukprot:TRINITY_DN3189_c0_g1_i1.p1 TRINITY_DN3189_c0_g1~~TRINITY_DN3189_c0_g1_i1.p1  ORF type:complete len:660 (-),score=237.78 TRINITY_DN3189_c0_g1_i1:24-1769(-)